LPVSASSAQILIWGHEEVPEDIAPATTSGRVAPPKVVKKRKAPELETE
jgi:hypothetical protein